MNTDQHIVYLEEIVDGTPHRESLTITTSRINCREVLLAILKMEKANGAYMSGGSIRIVKNGHLIKKWGVAKAV